MAGIQPHQKCPFSCATCPKFVPNVPDDLTKGGGCHDRPPVPVFMGWRENALTKQPLPMWQTMWPFVEHWNFCYSHPLAALAGFKAPLAGAVEPIPVNLPAIDLSPGGRVEKANGEAVIDPDEEEEPGMPLNPANDEAKH